jgi:hypothetical protein
MPGKLAGLGLLRGPKGDPGPQGPAGEDGVGGGGGAIHVDTLTDLRSVSPEPTSGTVYYVGSDPEPFVYDTTSGIGFADDGDTIIRISAGATPVALGSNGRFYRSSKTTVVATIAALRLAVAGKQKSIHVQAYYALGDGGGGVFDYDPSDVSTVDNGGTVIVAGTRRYKRRTHGAKIKALWFGCKPNDITFDSRAAIQAAIDYAYSLVGTNSGMVNSRKFGPVVQLPAGRLAVGFRPGFAHALEMLDTMGIEGEVAGTVLLPHSSVGTDPIALLRTWLYSNKVSHIQFLHGEHAIAICGTTSAGPLAPGVGPEHGNRIWGCEFNEQTGPSVFFDMNPSAGAGYYRSFQPNVQIDNCRFYGPHFIWGVFDHLVISHSAFGWDQANGGIVPELDASGLPLGLFTLGGNVKVKDCIVEKLSTLARDTLFHIDSAILLVDNLTEFDQGGCIVRCRSRFDEYTDPCTGDDMSLTGGFFGATSEISIVESNVNVASKNWLEVYEDFPYRILFDARILETTASSLGIWVSDNVNLTKTLTRSAYNCQIDIRGWRSDFSKIRQSSEADVFEVSGGSVVDVTDWFTAYAQPNAALLPKSAPPQNNLFTAGVYDAAQMAVSTTHASASGTDTGTGYTLTNYLTNDDGAVLTIRSADWGAGMPAAVYVWGLTLKADCRGDLTFGYQWRIDRTFTVNTTSNVVTSTIPVTAGTTVIAYTTGTLPAPMSAGTFHVGDVGIGGANTFKLYTDQDLDPSHLVDFTTAGTGTHHLYYEAQGAAHKRHQFTPSDEYQRAEFAFYFPGVSGSDFFKLTANIGNIENGKNLVVGLPTIHVGFKAAPYTFPVDDPTAPTDNVTTARQTATYRGTTVPTTGTYQTGDVFLVDPPVAGEPYAYVCTVAGSDPDFRFESLGIVADSTDPATETGHLTGFVAFDNGGASVNAGESVTIATTVTGAERGDDVLVSPSQDPGDGWIVTGEILDTDEVRVTVSNLTGANAPIPADPFGVAVKVTQHAPFEESFAGPKVWLTADTGYDAGTGTWVNQFTPGTLDAGPQATSGKRPTLVTGISGLGGHSILRATAAGATELDVIYNFTSTTSLYLVVGNFDATADIIIAGGNGGVTFIRYNRSGHTKEYEVQRGANLVTIGTTVNHADYHVLGIVQDDAGNLRTYFDGIQTNDVAAIGALGNLRSLFGYLGTSVPNFDQQNFLWFDALHTDAKAIEMCLKLKGRCKL